MMKLVKLVQTTQKAALRTLTLPFDERRKSRLRTQLDDGGEAALLLPRGTILRHGDVLESEDGARVLVTAASEALSVVSSDDAHRLMRAAYHLGNRHVPLQIAGQRLAYQHDHVLDDLVRALGLSVRSEQAPFEPEPGGYSHNPVPHTHTQGERLHFHD